MSKYNKNGTGKKIALTLAFLLTLGVAGTSLVMGITQNGWFKGNDTENEQPADDSTDEETGAQTVSTMIGNTTNNGISLMSTSLDSGDYETYGVSAAAETAYLLTATITPANATNKKVDWSVAFVDPSSTWASGKTVTDYVTVTPTSDGALTANVVCLQGFSSQIKVTVTSRSDSSISASCTLDYMERLESTTISIASYEMNGSQVKTIWSKTWDTSNTVNQEINIALDEMFYVNEQSDMRQFSGVGTMYEEDIEAYTLSASLSVNESLLSSLSSSTGYTFTAAEKVDITYSGASGVTLGSMLYVDGKPATETEAVLDALRTWLYNNSGTALFNLDITLTGEYCSYSQSVGLVIGTSVLELAVESLALDTASMIF